MLTRIKKFIYVLNRLQLGNPKIIKMEDESRLILLLKNLNILEHCATYEKNPQKKSCILSIKIPQIESLMSEDIVLNKATINLYRPNKTILVYDLSTEALTFTDYSALVLKRFHEILQKTKINPNDVILVCANSVAETHYTSWAKNNFFQNYKIKMLGYDFYFYEYFWELNRCAWL